MLTVSSRADDASSGGVNVCRTIGICGVSGSGKSSLSVYLATAISTRLPSHRVEIIHCDHYIQQSRAIAFTTTSGRVYDNVEHPDAIDWPKLLERIADVKRAMVDAANDAFTLILEGFLLVSAPQQLLALVDVWLYLFSDANTTSERRLKRSRSLGKSDANFFEFFRQIVYAHFACYHQHMIAHITHRQHIHNAHDNGVNDRAGCCDDSAVEWANIVGARETHRQLHGNSVLTLQDIRIPRACLMPAVMHIHPPASQPPADALDDDDTCQHGRRLTREQIETLRQDETLQLSAVVCLSSALPFDLVCSLALAFVIHRLFPPNDQETIRFIDTAVATRRRDARALHQ